MYAIDGLKCMNVGETPGAGGDSRIQGGEQTTLRVASSLTSTCRHVRESSGGGRGGARSVGWRFLFLLLLAFVGEARVVFSEDRLSRTTSAEHEGTKLFNSDAGCARRLRVR